MVSVIGSQS
jgi:hypothetical protein